MEVEITDMKIIDQWINELGLIKRQLQKENYRYLKNENVILVDINEIKPLYREIKREKYISGLNEDNAKDILSGISQNAILPPIEVVIYKNGDGKYNYELFDGYHRFNISKFLCYKKIPVIVKATKSILNF